MWKKKENEKKEKKKRRKLEKKGKGADQVAEKVFVKRE